MFITGVFLPADTMTYNETDFHCFFQLHQEIFNCILEACCHADLCFIQKKDDMQTITIFNALLYFHLMDSIHYSRYIRVAGCPMGKTAVLCTMESK